jgi:putative transposase
LKKAYPIQDARAEQQFETQMKQRKTPVQLQLPAAEMAEWLKQGVGDLIRQAGVILLQDVMNAEVEELVGGKHAPNEQRTGYRWGQEAGWCLVDGQKVPLERPRVRGKHGGEVKLGSYARFQREPAGEQKFWQDTLRGLSNRQYGKCIRRFQDAYGIEKSATSDKFIEVSRRKLRELLERPLGGVDLLAIMIDGKPIKGEMFIVAMGIARDGAKIMLGLRQGATENAEVVSSLCADMVERGLDFGVKRLYVLDGSKALSAAVRKHAGEAALIQRCQLHKRRNVLNHLPDEHQPVIEQKLVAAWAMSDLAAARQALEQVKAQLERLNPSAARSLAEGLEETLTIHRLGLSEALRKTFFSTNPIESALSVVEDKTRRVKRWRKGDMKLRWIASGLLAAEAQFRRVKGFRDLPQLAVALGRLPQDQQKTVASFRKAS